MFDDTVEVRKQREEAMKLLRTLRMQQHELAKRINGVELIVRGYDQLLGESVATDASREIPLIEQGESAMRPTRKPTIKSITLDMLKAAGSKGVARDHIRDTLIAQGYLRGGMDPDKYVQWIIASLRQKGLKITRNNAVYFLDEN